jgi:hypothetical protein
MRCSGQCRSARATRLRRAPYSARRPPRCGRPCRGSCSRPSRASSRLRRVVWRRAWLRRGASPPGASRAPGARRGALGTCPAALMSSTARARCPRCSWAVRARKRRALPAGGRTPRLSRRRPARPRPKSRLPPQPRARAPGQIQPGRLRRGACAPARQQDLSAIAPALLLPASPVRLRCRRTWTSTTLTTLRPHRSLTPRPRRSLALRTAHPGEAGGRTQPLAGALRAARGRRRRAERTPRRPRPHPLRATHVPRPL